MPETNKTFADTLNEVFKLSPFAMFPAKLLEQLQSDSIRLDIPAGGTTYTEEASPRCGLVVSGLFRVYMSSPDGR